MVTREQQQARWVADTYHAMRTAIGWELAMRYEPPQELTPKLVDLVAAMERACESGK